MKNIFLIGDSIRFGSLKSPGYGIYVKKQLVNQANVYAPDENCRFVQYTLRYLHEWAADIDKESIDIVHWNNGLWDVLRLLGDEPFTPCDVYADTLERVYRRIRKLFPHARIIFATSTPVIEEMATPEFERRNTDIALYNQAAIDRLVPLGVEINDLYQIASRFDYSLYADWVHFNEAGSEKLAQAVIAKLMSF